jgi:hypothetical protein
LLPSFHRLMGVTSWRCTLTDSKLRNQPRIEQPTIYYEIAFVLLTYAYALINWAGHGASGNEPLETKLNQVGHCVGMINRIGCRLSVSSGRDIPLCLRNSVTQILRSFKSRTNI